MSEPDRIAEAKELVLMLAVLGAALTTTDRYGYLQGVSNLRARIRGEQP